MGIKPENQPCEGNRANPVNHHAITPARRRWLELQELNNRLQEAEIKALKDLVDEIEAIQTKPKVTRWDGIR